jgi:ubiquinone/menaquinone biosynthesis C-methylase UbiE
MFSLKEKIKNWYRTEEPVTAPEPAYDSWAGSYDQQPDNLMLALETPLFLSLLKDAALEMPRIIDVGCGTGRHWQYLFDLDPGSLTGYDVSSAMLSQLALKFPGHRLVHHRDTILPEENAAADLLISTLALAHIPDAATALEEWVRVTDAGGYMLITDYHPEALAKGANRTFRKQGKLVSVKNYVHPLPMLLEKIQQLGITILRMEEKSIDASVKHWYEQQNAMHVYRRFEHVPIVYGLLLQKEHAAS